MLLLSVRTDKQEAELGLFEDERQIDYEVWQAHRELSTTLHNKLEELLARQHKMLADIEGIVCFKGPGSFTGLRIGLTVANTLAYSLSVPVVSSSKEAWIQDGIQRIMNGENEIAALPFYGAEAFVTKPRK